MASARVAAAALVGASLVELASGARKRDEEVAMRSDDESPFAARETTVNGCECTNQCGTTVGHWYKCDWCNVDKNCAGKQWGLTRGNWDFCAYEEVSNFERQSWQTKTNTLWQEVMATRGTTGPIRGKAQVLKLIISSSMRTPFDNSRDIMAPNRLKAIHAQGAVCKIDFEVASGSPYTGSFASGTQPGLIRMGQANGGDGFPGIAVKFMRSGVKSANLVALRESGTGSNSTFFGERMTNHVEPPMALAALQKFQQASACMSMVGISDISKHDKNGNLARGQNFPYKLIFEPHSDVSRYDAHGEAALAAMDRIPSGTRLFTIKAKSSPSAREAVLGVMRATSACHMTSFGDEQLHFEHQRMEEDFLLKPEWKNDVDHPGCTVTMKPPQEWMCGDQDVFPEE